jgi:predicted HicB family RNase H-like nuclease
MMEYKGYTGQITAVDEAQGIIHGEVTGINDIVTFEGKTSEDLVQAFHDSVDDYLEFCAERSESPEKPYSGKFLVRISPALHQQASLAAKKAGESLNAWVAAAIKAQLGKEGARTRGRPPKAQEWDTKTLLSLLEYLESRRPAIFPGRIGEAPYPMWIEPDPLSSTIIRALLEKTRETESEKGEEKGTGTFIE